MLSKNQIREIQALHLKKQREVQGRFIAEGVKTVSELVHSASSQVEKIFAIDRFLENNHELLETVRNRVVQVSDDELKKISLQASPNEVLAVATNFPAGEPQFDANRDFSFYLDDIRDPGNLGTILRLADWFGIRTVFCSADTCELYNPKVIQASMGAFLRVKVHYEDLDAVIGRHHVKQVYGAVLDGRDLYSQKLASGIIVIGNEANGIGDLNLKHINFPVTIPAAGSSGTESLNAAMATAIIASEFFRQRRQQA